MGIHVKIRKEHGKAYLIGKYLVSSRAKYPLSTYTNVPHEDLRKIIEKTLELEIKNRVIRDSLDELLKQYSGSLLIDGLQVRVLVDSSVKEPLLVVTPDDYSRIIELEGFVFLESEVDEYRNRPD